MADVALRGRRLCPLVRRIEQAVPVRAGDESFLNHSGRVTPLKSQVAQAGMVHRPWSGQIPEHLSL